MRRCVTFVLKFVLYSYKGGVFPSSNDKEREVSARIWSRMEKIERFVVPHRIIGVDGGCPERGCEGVQYLCNKHLLQMASENEMYQLECGVDRKG